MILDSRDWMRMKQSHGDLVNRLRRLALNELTWDLYVRFLGLSSTHGDNPDFKHARTVISQSFTHKLVQDVGAGGVKHAAGNS